jgi:hypothetical protein
LDLLLAGCDNVLFRFGAAILVLLETHLIVMSTEELMMVGFFDYAGSLWPHR